MSRFSDSDHRKLEATVLPDCVVESHQVSDTARGLRRVQITKLWRTERIIGHGAFGEVLLQALDNDVRNKRALKVIRGVKMTPDECQRELTALIEFTKPKVGWRNNPPLMHESIADSNIVSSSCGLRRFFWLVPESKRPFHVFSYGVYAGRGSRGESFRPRGFDRARAGNTGRGSKRNNITNTRRAEDNAHRRICTSRFETKGTQSCFSGINYTASSLLNTHL